MDRKTIKSWGGVHVSKSWQFNPVNEKEVVSLFKLNDEYGVIPRGSGNSYGDQALNSKGGIVSIQDFPEHDELSITSEGYASVHGGTSYAALLSASVKQGWIMPVVPGSKSITIGGAIAADAHGKNHFHKSSISSCLIDIDLLTSKGSVVRCDRSHEPELFWATVGGFGLTGLILKATVQLEKIGSNQLNVKSEKFLDFDELINRFNTAASSHSYCVAWLDLLSKTQSGRGIIQSADPASASSEALSYESPQRVSIPELIPFNLVNKASCGVFNTVKFHGHPSEMQQKSVRFPEFLHPLDRVRNWNNLYGRKGFFQWQIVVPETEESFLEEIISKLGDLPLLPSLAVLKRLGVESGSYLSFCKPGWTLAVDFPFGSEASRGLLHNFDKRLADIGGRIYLAKDGGMNPDLLNAMYPRLGDWKQIRKEYDPGNIWQSDFSRRLNLTDS